MSIRAKPRRGPSGKASRSTGSPPLPPQTAALGAKRAELREALGFVVTPPSGREYRLPIWDDSRCIRWAVDAFKWGIEIGKSGALKELRAAAEESPHSTSPRAERALADAKTAYGESCRWRFKCFQMLAAANEDARSDLGALGYKPTPHAIEAYVREIASWPSILPPHSKIDGAISEAKRTGPLEALRALPQAKERVAEEKRQGIELDPKPFDAWHSSIRQVCRVQLIHDRALELRREFLQLTSIQLPAVTSFAVHLNARLQELDRDLEGSLNSVEFQRLVSHALVAAEENLRQIDRPGAVRRSRGLKRRLESLIAFLSASGLKTRQEEDLQRGAHFIVGVIKGIEGARTPLPEPLNGLGNLLQTFPKYLAESPKAIHAENLGRTIGSSAALASRWRVGVLKRQLSEADFLLSPLGSYLSRWREPKQLRVRYALDGGLRDCLGPGHSDHAKSRAIAAAFMVYAKNVLGPSGSVSAAAKNTVEKLRRRMNRLEAVEQMNELRDWYD